MAGNSPDKREALIKAALKLFTKRGFHDTPTALISKEAGVSTGTLFRYFPTKEDLINSTYSRARDHMLEAVKAGLDEEDTMEDNVQRIWKNTIRWGVQNPEEFLFIEQFTSSPYLTKLNQDETLCIYNFFVEILEDGIRNGVIKDVRMDLIIDMLADTKKSVIKKIMLAEPGDVDMLLDRSFELVWDGIRIR